MSETQPAPGRVILGCSDDSIEVLSVVVREIERRGHTVDLVSGIDMDVELFTGAIRRHQGQGVYVICKGVELDEYQARKLQEAAKGLGVDPSRVLVVRSNLGTDDIVRRVTARITPSGRHKTLLASAGDLPARPRHPLSGVRTKPTGFMRGGAAAEGEPHASTASVSAGAASVAPPPRTGERVGGSSVRLGSGGGASPAAAPPRSSPPPLSASGLSSSLAGADDVDEELPTANFSAKDLEDFSVDADLAVEVEPDPEVDAEAFTPGGRVLGMLRSGQGRWIAAAAGLLLVVVGAAAAMSSDDSPEDAVAEGTVAAPAEKEKTSEPAPDPEPADPSGEPKVEGEQADDTAAPDPEPALEPETEAAVEPEAEAEEEPEQVMEEMVEVPDDAGLVEQALRKRAVRALDVLLFQPHRSKKRMRHGQAEEYCAEQEIMGVKGWRLPTIGELHSLSSARMLRRDYYWTQTPADTFGERHLVLRSGSNRIYPRTSRWRGGRAVCVRTRNGEPVPAETGE